ncbi:hypothetical protein B0T16DRAFT_423633 [Cercophora newfieldiana]|uniref:Uncharacterized protein n=1 Tax=Cercophora newfieldiana TaxID=92897 RepID=A0AA40CIK9_9PEZI|nr:hypothetical protein B0T16DRAFT_423633 [Cercophora newfieldiana]
MAGDKLVALAGVAERIIASHGGEQYLAGLWRSANLLWRVDITCWPYPRPSESRAPTWSWASIDSEIRSWSWNWPESKYPDISFMASLVGIAIIAHPKDYHKTGKVYGSRLEMRGRLKKVPRP